MIKEGGGALNTRQKSYYRDRLVLETLEKYGVLNTLQLHYLVFSKDTKVKRKVQQRTKHLHEKKKIKRWKSAGQYAFSLEEKNKLSGHLEDVNWIRLWYEKTQQRAGWEVQSFQYEQDFRILRADGLVALKNRETGLFAVRFIEMDRSPNKFDKITKYNKLFESQESLESYWWYKLVERFPRVLIVTTNRKESILKHIEEENTNGLKFDVKLLSDIRRECECQ